MGFCRIYHAVHLVDPFFFVTAFPAGFWRVRSRWSEGGEGGGWGGFGVGADPSYLGAKTAYTLGKSFDIYIIFICNLCWSGVFLGCPYM